MYDPSIAEANTNMGNNEDNFERTISILFVDEVYPSFCPLMYSDVLDVLLPKPAINKVVHCCLLVEAATTG